MRTRRKIAEGTRFRVLQRDKFRCRYCGAHGSETELHIDHIQPVSAGGTNDQLNLVTSCKACNLGKHARSPEWHLTHAVSFEGRCTRNIDDIEDHECGMPRELRGWWLCRHSDIATNDSHREACA